MNSPAHPAAMTSGPAILAHAPLALMPSRRYGRAAKLYGWTFNGELTAADLGITAAQYAALVQASLTAGHRAMVRAPDGTAVYAAYPA